MCLCATGKQNQACETSSRSLWQYSAMRIGLTLRTLHIQIKRHISSSSSLRSCHLHLKQQRYNTLRTVLRHTYFMTFSLPLLSLVLNDRALELKLASNQPAVKTASDACLGLLLATFFVLSLSVKPY